MELAQRYRATYRFPDATPCCRRALGVLQRSLAAPANEPVQVVLEHVASFRPGERLCFEEALRNCFAPLLSRSSVDAFIRRARPVTGGSPGAVWIERMARALEDLKEVREPALILRALGIQLERAPRQATKRDTFAGHDVAWKVWKAFGDAADDGAPPLRDQLTEPLRRWMATRLARLFPVVIALYERVKIRRQALDQLDLLVKLRDLLVENGEVRRQAADTGQDA